MQSWLGKLVLVLVLAPMAFLGVQTFSGGTGIAANEIVKVGDTSVSLQEFNAQTNERKIQLQQMVDASLINDKALADEVLDSMIQRALLENQTKFLGMTISDETITRLLQQEPTFFGADGKFSNDVFASYLQQRGMTKDMLFANFRTQLSLRQLTASILKTAVYPSGQISRLIDIQTQSREVWVHRYQWQDYANKVSISPEEIQSYYQANSSQLNRPATVDLSYIELDPQSVKVDAPSEEEIKAQYQIYLQNSGISGDKELSQILLTGNDAQTRAKDIKAKLDAGSSFEELAKAHSDDPSGKDGGGMGTFNPTVFGDDARVVQDAIAPLTVGQVSEPIKTAFGYQIFKVTKMADVPKLDDLRDELTKQATEHKRQGAIDELIAKVDALAVDGVGLADIAKEISATVKTIKNYPQEDNKTELSMPAIVAAAFDESAIADQAVSANLKVAGKVVWLQSTNHQEAKTLSLEEASTLIKERLTQEKASKLAFEEATAKANSAKSDPKALATSTASVGVVGMQSMVLRPAEQASLFLHNTPDGMSVWAVQTETGASVMVANPIITNSQSSLSPAEKLQASIMIRGNVGQDQLSDYLRYLQDTNEVIINKQAMNQR